MKIVIIEDEQWVAEELADSLQALNQSIEIVAILNSVEEGIAFFNNPVAIDLIFSDIQLGDGLSFEIVKNIPVTIPVIFCTAFDEYALEAFDTNSIAYILKPFSKVTLEKAIKKYLHLKHTFNQEMRAKYVEVMNNWEASKQEAAVSTIIVRYRSRIIPLSIEKIALIHIENGITYLHLHTGSKYVHNESLDDLEKKLVPVFFRVNRQYLINHNCVKNSVQLFSRKLQLEFTINWKKEVFVSKEKKVKLIEWLEK